MYRRKDRHDKHTVMVQRAGREVEIGTAEPEGPKPFLQRPILDIVALPLGTTIPRHVWVNLSLMADPNQVCAKEHFLEGLVVKTR